MRWIILFVALGMMGCGGGESSSSTSPQFVSGFNPPAPAAGEMQIVSPSLGIIKSGDDKTLCTYLDYNVKEDMDVLGFHMYQAVTGHHVTLYRAIEKRPVGTHECIDADMFNIRFLAGGGATAPTVQVPDGLAFRVKAGDQLMIVSHWLNTTSSNAEIQAAANLKVAEPSPDRQISDLFVVATSNINNPPAAQTDNTATCVFKNDTKIWMLCGHAHEFTRRVTIDHIANGGSERLYDQIWQPEYTTNAPSNYYTRDAPLVVKAGESLTTTCTVDNTKGTDPITFPREMCTSVGFFFPSQGEMICSDGAWQ